MFMDQRHYRLDGHVYGKILQTVWDREYWGDIVRRAAKVSNDKQGINKTRQDKRHLIAFNYCKVIQNFLRDYLVIFALSKSLYTEKTNIEINS